MKINQNDHGMASVVMVGLIIVVLAAIGFGGYKIYQAGKSASKSDNQTKKTEEKPAELVATIEASKTTAKVSASNDFNNLDIVSLTIKYTNNTSAPLTNVQFKLSAQGVGSGDTLTAKFNQAASANGVSVFDVADVAASSSATATVNLFLTQAGPRKISGTVTASGGKTATTNTVTVTGN